LELAHCDFCKERDCIFCPVTFNTDKQISDIYACIKKKRSLVILAEIGIIDKTRVLYDKIPDLRKSALNLITQDNLTLYDCLDCFSQLEKLEMENAWFCSNCKEHREANKKIELFWVCILALPSTYTVESRRCIRFLCFFHLRT